MIENQRQRIEKAMADMINNIYKTHLRKMQSDMHLCAVNCCDDLNHRPSFDHVLSCVEDCAGPLLRAQDYIQHELMEFQTKLQGCIMQCNNDDVRGGNISKYTKDSDMSKNRYQFENCMIKCVDKHIGLIPNMMRSINTVLSNGPNDMKRA